MRSFAKAVVPLALSVLLLSSCSGIREQLGLGKTSPDEFRVTSRAPLTLPPNFGERPGDLPDPDPGAPRPQTGTTADVARRTVFGPETNNSVVAVNDALPADGRSLGERSILVAAGATDANPGIRQLVNSETDQINSDNDDFLRELIFWQDKEPPGVLLDPELESKRLQENATLGKDVTEGETPVIERKEKALFEF
ncbi:MAG: DUF3035 domain-containing protein [Kiloniellales bacterium]|nr:DUF3035 domain-containing protein [Kiloniellales bacterium]